MKYSTYKPASKKLSVRKGIFQLFLRSRATNNFNRILFSVFDKNN